MEEKEGLVKCYECGDYFEECEMKKTSDGDFVCKQCAEDEYLVCEHCGKLTQRDFITSIAGEDMYVCEECIDYSGDFETCDGCGEVFLADNLTAYDNNRGSLCEACAFDSDYSYCDCCGELYTEENLVETSDGDYYCRTCYEIENTCPVCHTVLDPDDVCCSCCNPYAPRIESYHSVSRWGRFGEMDDGEEWGGVGFELEIEPPKQPEGERRACIRTGLLEFCKCTDIDKFSFQRDSSLDNGVEIISQPHTLKAFRNLTELRVGIQALKDAGCVTTSRCGLHFHFSRTLFGDTISLQRLSIAKTQRFFSKFYCEMLGCSQRRSEESCIEYSKKDTEVSKAELAESCASGSSRYNCVNTSNRNTIEFRLGQSVLDYDTIMVMFEIYVHIIKMSQELNWLEVDILDNWIEGLGVKERAYFDIFSMRFKDTGVQREDLEVNYSKIKGRREQLRAEVEAFETMSKW